jgi:hypothetical protein
MGIQRRDIENLIKLSQRFPRHALATHINFALPC